MDSKTKIIYAVVATAANVHDSAVPGHLLHGEETRVWGDQAYRGQREHDREHAPRAKDFTNPRYRHRGMVDEAQKAPNRTKSRVRAKVEHRFAVIKGVFFRVHQTALSRAGEERPALVCCLLFGQLVHDPKTVDARLIGQAAKIRRFNALSRRYKRKTDQPRCGQ